jgi:uncharacterized protein YjbJ (UPF0337 family)
MDNTRIEGMGHQLKGAVKETVGKIIGDAKLVSDGAAERARGHAQTGAGGGPLIPGIDTDRIAGVGHQLKGAIKQGFGNLIGDAKLAADGSAERSLGKSKDAAGSARDEARRASRKTQESDITPAAEDSWKDRSGD